MVSGNPPSENSGDCRPYSGICPADGVSSPHRGFVRALSDPYPNAYTYFRGGRLRLISSHVSRCTYGGTPGRVFIEEDGGMVIVAGAEAYRGQSPGLVLDVVRTDDGVDHDALVYFGRGGGYLTGEP